MAGARGTGLALAANGGRIVLRIGEPGRLVGAFVIIDAGGSGAGARRPGTTYAAPRRTA
jgi:hypothetical protein